MSVAVGDDVESICGKCGDVWHVVVAMVGTKVAKVQCKQCMAYHRHRPPGGSAKNSAVKRKAPQRRTAAKKSAVAEVSSEPAPLVEADTSQAIRPYKTSEIFEPRQRIDHIKFGTGVVEEAGNGKITVFFPSGRRVLAQAKASAKLTRPAPLHLATETGGE